MVATAFDISRDSYVGYKYDNIAEKSCDCFGKNRNTKRILLKVTFATFKLLLLIFLFIFVIFPLIFKFSYALHKAVVFLNFFHIPPNGDFEHPSKYGLPEAKNVYVTTDEDVKLGVWMILHEGVKYVDNKTDFESVLGDGRNAILYNHGNGGNRLTPHRVELYRVLRKQFHVIAFDYRSYGDSTNIDPTEEGLVNDIIYMYKWAQNRTTGNLFVWGHSLGTSLSTNAMAKLQTMGHKPKGLFLESPFNNMREEISEFPMARLFRNLPWFTFTVVDPIIESNFRFETDIHICQVDVPIMILHAEDDGVVPFKLGYKLYESALKCRSKSQGIIVFKRFESSLNYGHKYICRHPDIQDIISKFMDKIRIRRKPKIEKVPLKMSSALM